MKKWNKENIITLIQTNDAMVVKSVIQLYQKQTEDEKETESTNHHNNRGFTSGDAKKMTGMAKFAKKTGFLTSKQIAYLRPRLIKYATQIAKIANEINERKMERV